MIKSLFGLLLIICLFLASLGLVVYRLQSPTFVVNSAESVNLYGRLSENAATLIPADQFKAYGLSASDLTEVVSNVIPSNQFYGFVGTALNAYLPWFSGKTNQLTFSYDLTATKQKIADQAATKIRAKYDNLALCTQAQLRGWSFDTSLPTCRLAPGTLSTNSIDNQIRAGTSKLVEKLPDQLTTTAPSASLIKVRSKIAFAFEIIYGIWAITAALILLFLVAYKSRGLIALAITFLIVGLLEVAFSLVGWDWIGRTLGDLINGATDAKSIVPIIIDLVDIILSVMKTTYGNISIVFLGSGVGLLFLGIILKFRAPKIVSDLSK